MIILPNALYTIRSWTDEISAKMEKINKEELMNMLSLSEEELEKIAGGGYISACVTFCSTRLLYGEDFDECFTRCINKSK